MRVAIHQPNFCPWLGYFYKIRHADLFVLLDDVQFIKRGYIHRNYVKTPQGQRWIGLPVLTKGRYDQEIREVEINPTEPWRKQILGSLRHTYAQAPHATDVLDLLGEIFTGEPTSMAQLNEQLLRAICPLLGIHTPILRSSSLPGIAGQSTERLISICQAVGAEQYLSGSGGKNYQNEAQFAAAGIELQYSQFTSPRYPQLHGEFVPNLSVLDALFCVGAAAGDLLAACPPPQSVGRQKKAA